MPRRWNPGTFGGDPQPRWQEFIEDLVMEDLEREFGHVRDTDDDLQIAVGFPPSTPSKEPNEALVLRLPRWTTSHYEIAVSRAKEALRSRERVLRAIVRCLHCGQRFCGPLRVLYCSTLCQRAHGVAVKQEAASDAAARADVRKREAAVRATARAETRANGWVSYAQRRPAENPIRKNTVAAFRSLIGAVLDEKPVPAPPAPAYDVACSRCTAHSPSAPTPEAAVRNAMAHGFVSIERVPGKLETVCAECRRARFSEQKPSDLYNFKIAERFLIASKWQPELFLKAHGPGQSRWAPRDQARVFTVEEIDREISAKEVDDLYFVVVGRGEQT